MIILLLTVLWVRIFFFHLFLRVRIGVAQGDFLSLHPVLLSGVAWPGLQNPRWPHSVSGAMLSTVGWKPQFSSAQPSSSGTAWTCLHDSWVPRAKVKFASPRGPGLSNSQKISSTHFPGQTKTRQWGQLRFQGWRHGLHLCMSLQRGVDIRGAPHSSLGATGKQALSWYVVSEQDVYQGWPLEWSPAERREKEQAGAEGGVQ